MNGIGLQELSISEIEQVNGGLLSVGEAALGGAIIGARIGVACGGIGGGLIGAAAGGLIGWGIAEI